MRVPGEMLVQGRVIRVFRSDGRLLETLSPFAFGYVEKGTNRQDLPSSTTTPSWAPRT